MLYLIGAIALLVVLTKLDKNSYKSNTGPNAITLNDSGQRYQYTFNIRGKVYTGYSDREFRHKEGALNCCDFIQYRKLPIGMKEGDIVNLSESLPVEITAEDINAIYMDRIDRKAE